MIRHRVHSFVSGLVAFFALLGGVDDAFGAERVVLQLKWDHQFQFAGYYAAKWEGYYADAGLEVAIRPGVRADRKILDIVNELETGRANFGVGGAELLVARDRGAPLMVCAVIFQQSATEFYALEEQGVRSIADLLDHRVARTPNSLSDIELRAMLLAEGIDPSQVPPYPTIAGLGQLLAGDVVAGYNIDMPYHARRLGLELTSLRPSDYAADFYGDSLFTTRALVEQNPDLVEKFVAASLKGWEYALEHPEEIAGRIARDLPRTFKLEDPVGFFRFESEGVRALTLYPTVKVGHLNPRRWLQIHSFLKRNGLVEGALAVEDFIFDPARLAAVRAEKRLEKQHMVLLVFAGIAGLALAFALLMHRRQQAHRREMEHLRAIFNSIYDAIFIHRRDGSIAFVNEVGVEMFGLVPEKATQYSVADFSAPGSPVDQIPTIIDEAIRKGEKGPFEWRVKRPLDGAIIDVEVFLRLVSLKKGEFILATVRDLTDRKQAEEALLESERKLSDLTRNLPGMAYRCRNDLYWTMEYVSDGCRTLTGYRADDLIGNKRLAFAEIIHPDDRERLKGTVDAGLAERQPFQCAYRIRTARGDIRWVLEVGRGVSTEGGEPESLEGFLADITDRKQVEEDLKEANRELDAFVYTVSHDLRTPLTPIIGYADFLRERFRDSLDAQALDCLAKISTSGLRMLSVMEDLLTLAKVGQVERPAKPFDTEKVVNGVVSVLARQLSQAEVAVEVGYLPPLRVPETLLSQIFDNLIGNALRYAGREGSPIEIRGERRGDLVRFYVRDHGPGIPKEERSRIFEVFYRGAAGKKSPGTGVGLATVQKIARLYGGRIWVEETEGCGSTFWVEMVDVETSAEKEEDIL